METFSALRAICAGSSLVISEFPAQRPVTWSFDVFFHLRLNKWLSKQLWGWWFEMPLHSLWCHSNEFTWCHTGPVMWGFDVSFLTAFSYWWSETLLCSCDATSMISDIFLFSYLFCIIHLDFIAAMFSWLDNNIKEGWWDLVISFMRISRVGIMIAVNNDLTCCQYKRLISLHV